MKKILSAALSALILLSALTTAFGYSAAAASYTYVENGLHFELRENNKATLIGCDEDVESINLVDKLDNGYDVTAIADNAFKGNINLLGFHSIIDLEEIGDYAFEACSHLSNVNIDAGVKRIGVGAFSTCTSLNSLHLDSDVSEIDNGAFFYNTNLKSFNFPKNLQKIGEYVFAFSDLTTVIMNNKITEIPSRLFYECLRLENIKLPKNLKKIGDYAFGSCAELDIEDIPDSLNEIGDYAFTGCNISSISFNGSKIGEGAFSNSYGKLENVNFSDNLKEIGKLAFTNTKAEKIELPDNVNLENGAFAGTITEGFKVKSTNDKYVEDDGVIYTKDKKELVLFPAKKYPDIEYKDEDSPDEQKTNSIYTIPKGVEKISPYAFMNASGLSEVKMPDSLKEIGECAFEKVSTLEKINIPDKVKILKKNTFTLLSNNAEVNLGSVEKIENQAFFNCFYENVNIKIPDTVKEFTPMSFADSRVKLSADGNYKSIDGVLYTADGKKLVYYPNSRNKSFTIPDGVEEIGSRAFAANENTTEIYIPDSLKTIGEDGLEYNISYTNDYETKTFTDGIHLIGNASESVKTYADNHNIGVFTTKPSQNITSATLKGKQTKSFKINGADINDVVYTSGDDKIASVTDKGTIKGLKKGTVYVTAAIGTTYFKCKVKVTSNSGIKYTGFDDSNYYKVTPKTYSNWRDDFQDKNRDIFGDFIDEVDEAAMGAYQGNQFYNAMNGVVDRTGKSHAEGIKAFGVGYEDMISMLNHACNKELGRHKNISSLVLYSGAKSYASKLVAGEYNTLKNLRAGVGKTINHAQYISTSLSPYVADSFYSKGEGVVMIIYAEKNALDNLPAGLIAAMHSDFEYEELLATNSSFEVIDAGVRWFNDKEWREDYSESRYQRYVKLRLLGGNKTPSKLLTPKITLSKTPKSLYVKGTVSIYPNLKNTYDQQPVYSSSNKKVAKISASGKITALKKGTTTITVSNSETKTTFKLTVKKPTLSKTKLSLEKGGKYSLKIKGKVGKAVFKSKNRKIASVSKKGVIKAKAKGKTTITVKTNGLKLKCKITVK